MSYPTDFSRHRPMTEEEAVEAIRFAIHMRARYLRTARWTKGLTLEDVLKRHGIEVFAREVAAQLVQSNIAFVKGPPYPPHSTPAGHRGLNGD